MPPEKDFLQTISSAFYERKTLPRYTFQKLRLPRPDRALRGKPAHEGLRTHVTHDYHLMQKVVKRPDLFRTPVFTRKAMGRFIGYEEPALIMDNGASWRALHDVLVKFFSKKAVAANILPIVANETEMMINRWLPTAGKPVDIEHNNRTLTARVIMRVIFGDTMKERDGSEIIEAASVSLQSFRTPSLLTIFSRFAGEHYDHIPPMSQELKEAQRVIDGKLQDAVDERHRTGPQGGDILDHLIAAREVDNQSPFSDRRVMNNVLMFIVAGHETTAESISFDMYELLKNPRALEKMLQEIDALTGGTDRLLDADDYPHLVYTRNAGREGLRMHSTAWQIGREALQDCEIDAGGEIGVVKFLKGDLVLGNLTRMHHDLTYFSNPYKFMPERFDAYPKTDPVGLMNFGGGARVCIAPEMAFGEKTIVSANVFNRVSLRMTEEPEGEDPAFTLRMKGKLLAEAMARHP